MNTLKFIAYIFLVQLFIGLIGISNAFGQDALRYKVEIENFKPASAVNSKNLAVFAGSSSIKLWENLAESFPRKNVLNCGFGGSEMSDLIYFADEAIIRYKPVTVFIYEGDNDLGSGKSPELVLNNARKLIGLIHSSLPNTKIVFITPKPSMKRWDDGYKDNFLKYNNMLMKLTKEYKYVKMVDVWNIMLDKNGMPEEKLFQKDHLHMTEVGYALWTKKMKKYVP